MRFGAWIASATCLFFVACAGEGSGGLASSSRGLTLSPAGEWKLEDNALDTSGNGNDGTITGATFIDGTLRRALHFNGGTDSLNLGSGATLQFDLNEAFSTSLWANTTPNGANHALIGTAWSGPGWHVRVNAQNMIRFILVENGNTYRFADSTVALTSGWHHIATSWDGVSAMHIYLDGVDVTGGTQTSGTLTTITSSANVVVGQLAGTSAPYTGDIDQIRVFGGELTGADVTELFTESDNTAPVATAGSASTAQDTPVTITLSGTDAENDPLTFAIAMGPSNGTLGPIVQLTPTSATVQYTPNASYAGPDSFTFTVDDTRDTSAPATVGITVNAASIGLVGEWKFENDTLDTSGNGNDGTANGPVFAAGKVGTAMQFDGANDSVGVGTGSTIQFALGETFSTSSWINSSLSGTNQAIIGNSWAGPGWHVRLTSGNRIRFIVVEEDHTFNYFDSTITVASGWHHVVTTWDGATAHVYVDNVDVTGSVVQNGVVSLINSSAQVMIGNLPDSNTPFSGLLDQVRLYDTVLKISEIQTLFDEGSANLPPVANSSSVGTQVDTPVTITLTGSDTDGDPLTFAIVSGPASGTLGTITQLSPTTASVQYTPNASFTGSDSFTFTVDDGQATSAEATLTILVSAVPSPLVGQWELEDEALDYSEFMNDGTINGGATFVDGYVGRALRFDGIDDSLSLGNGSSIQFGLGTPFSTSLWLNATVNGANHAIIGNTWSGPGWHVRITSTNAVRFLLVQNSTTHSFSDSTVQLTTGWHHVATTWDGVSSMHIYIDGVDVSGTQQTSAPLTSIANGGNVTVGTLAGVSIPFLGDMDQIRLFNVALTGSEVTELFQETD